MNRYQVDLNGKKMEVTLLKRDASNISFSVEGETYNVEIKPILSERVQTSQVIEGDFSRRVSTASPQVASSSSVCAPMPGIVVSVAVKVGQEVKGGETLLVIEAMKMENNISAPRAARIKEIHVKKGSEVQNSQLLISLE